MSISIENVGPCRKKLRVEVPAERVAGARAEILLEFRKVASLPGFRPGKAPEPMVEKRYAKEIEEELHRRIIPESYREVLLEQKLHVVGHPQVESVENQPGRPLVYVAAVDTAPEFKLPEYRGIRAKKKELPVKDEDIKQTLEALREQQADFIPVEGRGLKTGDFAILNYTGVANGKPIADLVPEARTLGEHKDFWVLVASDAFLPGFCDQLLGATAGEKRQVLVGFPADFPQKPVAGVKATYFVDVAGIREKKLPELNDEFAKKAGMDTLEKLKEEIRKGLATEREGQMQADLRKQVVDQLLAQVEFELPESLVAQETRGIIHDMVRENSLRGITKEQLEQRKDEIFGFALRNAKERLRASFVLEAIADAEQIKVETAEVTARIGAMAERYRVTPERLRAQLEERDGLGELEEQIRIGKTIDFLLTNAKVEAA